MKRIILVASLCITLALLTHPSTAQYKQQPTGYNPQYEAGKLLRDFSRQYFIGLGVISGGYVLTLAGVSGKETNDELLTVGGIAILAGSIVMITSHSKIGRAGEQLMISSQSLGFNNQRLNSVGWAFHLGRSERAKAGG